MSQFTVRLGALHLILVSLGVMASGCGPKAVPAGSSAGAAAVEEGAKGPAKIELSDAKVTPLEPMFVQFEVKYRFSEGRPASGYTLMLSFPDIKEQCMKGMEAFEVKPEGVIRDKFRLSKPIGKSFEMHMGESPSSSHAYHQRSNLVTGTIE